jgi:hypothetical protein
MVEAFHECREVEQGKFGAESRIISRHLLKASQKRLKIESGPTDKERDIPACGDLVQDRLRRALIAPRVKALERINAAHEMMGDAVLLGECWLGSEQGKSRVDLKGISTDDFDAGSVASKICDWKACAWEARAWALQPLGQPLSKLLGKTKGESGFADPRGAGNDHGFRWNRHGNKTG